MKKEQLFDLAKRKIDAKRFWAQDECDKKLDNLRKNPAWRECERNLKEAQVSFVVSEGKQKESANARIKKYSQQRAELLKIFGYTEADLTPDYSCKLCSDTGYVDNHACRCLQNEIHKIIAEGSEVGNAEFTFANSAETNKHNVAVYKRAKEATQNGQNIFLTGNTGSGKTYLLSACANLAVEQNKSALFVTAYTLNSMFLESHLSDLATKQAILDSLVDVDLLAIDDLGTETVYKNVTAEYLFSVINERINRKKQTFISTNLTLEDVRDRYDERIFSRLVDQKLTFVAQLIGNDKRLNG